MSMLNKELTAGYNRTDVGVYETREGSEDNESITLSQDSDVLCFHDDFFGIEHEFDIGVFDPPSDVRCEVPGRKKIHKAPSTNSTFGELQNSPDPKADAHGDKEESNVQHYEIFQAVHADVNTWSGAFSGLAQWPAQLDNSYRASVESDNVEGWLSNVWEHAAKGRELLCRLRSMEGRLPYEMWKIREMWRLEVELVETVVRGISCLELRSSLVETGHLNLVTGVME
ncbi:hypothetical protein BDZ94DRAFT_1259831 [Collybia nuda]|uniref:Uncharacterized protein n=1 Tax=Collybia nuda TaxID=64659 RepID=A0A9P6CEH7_9AGAR|nr:hypothetical protein BDZ94DRAFT_1259831 [Collybia nuda]